MNIYYTCLCRNSYLTLDINHDINHCFSLFNGMNTFTKSLLGVFNEILVLPKVLLIFWNHSTSFISYWNCINNTLSRLRSEFIQAILDAYLIFTLLFVNCLIDDNVFYNFQGRLMRIYSIKSHRGIPLHNIGLK